MKGPIALAKASGSCPRVISTCNTSCSARTACGPPAAVQPRISERTLLGYCNANSCAIIPPMDTPKMCAVLTRAAFSTAVASAAICAIEYGPGGASLRPTPRLSSAMVRYFSPSTGRVRCQACEDHAKPMINSRGAPLPSSSQWILAPRFSTKGMEAPSSAAQGNDNGHSRVKRLSGSERSEEHTSELQSHSDLVCRLLLEKKKHISH